MANPADAPGPAASLPGRCHGSLGSITDSEQRMLRPIGSTVAEVTAATGGLLAGLLVLPAVRIFQGVSSGPPELPRIPYVILAGRQLLLVESVAWPPGRYVAAPDGRIHCDGVYIGQSIRPLAAAVRHWRGVLPADHRVSALVVVHAAADGELALPLTARGDLAWARAADAVRCIRAALPGREQASMVAVAALAAAITAGDDRWQPRSDAC